MIAERLIQVKLIEYSRQFRAVALTGARQTGKTTLIRQTFPDKTYLNFENLDTQLFAREDPKGFLSGYREDGAIFDEVQKVPELFSYLQQILDEEKESGKYILTGSSNFLLNQHISQSLAGRVGFLQLYSLSVKEITDFMNHEIPVWDLMLLGGYPEIWSRKVSPQYYYNSYIQSFIEKDIRQLLNVRNQLLFQQFVRLTAARATTEWNSSAIARELGIHYKTVQSWVGYLEVAGIIYFLPPYFENFGKRVIKSPKLYFYDTGLLSNLLGITSADQITVHPLKGSLFENFVVGELVRYNSLKKLPSQLFYWRAASGIEVDAILTDNLNNTSIEIKSGSTYQSAWWKNIIQWNALSEKNKNGIIIYSGDDEYNLTDGRKVVPLTHIYNYFFN